MSPRYPADVSDRPWQVNCYEPLLGTRVDIAIQADDPDAAHRADERARATIEQLTGVFSLYDPDSELCRWRRGELANPGDELAGVLERSCRIWQTRCARYRSGRRDATAGFTSSE